MMILRLLVATVVLLGTSVVAHATILASSSIYGGTIQDTALCYVFNAGTTVIHFTSNQIIRQDGVSLSLTFDNCSTLGPGDTCVIAAAIGNSFTHACKFVFPESKTNIRGSLEIRDGGTVLTNIELR
jgi:hypothetical protein